MAARRQVAREAAGGDAVVGQEEQAADWIVQNNIYKKPVVAFICGQTAPAEKRMGHAGAIVSGGKGTADSKMKHLQSKGITVVKTFTQIGDAIKKLLG